MIYSWGNGSIWGRGGSREHPFSFLLASLTNCTASVDHDDNDDVITLAHFFWNLARGHKTGNKKRLDGRKHNNACTSVPVRKGTVLISHGIPYRITCNEILPGAYPWHIRKREKEDEDR